MTKITCVKFYESVSDELLKFAVIIAKTDDKFIFCKHKQRDTFEVAGGHREQGEGIDETARRELYEETGAKKFSISPICVYSVVSENDDGTTTETFGKLFFATVTELENDIHSEIEKIIITDSFPRCWTYPYIQPKLLEEAKRRGFI